MDARCTRLVGNGVPQGFQVSDSLREELSHALCLNGRQSIERTTAIRGGISMTISCNQPCVDTQPVRAEADSNSDSWDGSGDGSGSGSWNELHNETAITSESTPLLQNDILHTETNSSNSTNSSQNATLAAAALGLTGATGGGSLATAGAITGTTGPATAGGLTAGSLMIGVGTVLGLTCLVLGIGAIIAIKTQSNERQRNENQRNDIESQPPRQAASNQDQARVPDSTQRRLSIKQGQELRAVSPPKDPEKSRQTALTTDHQVTESELKTLFDQIKSNIKKLNKTSTNWEIFKKSACNHIKNYSESITSDLDEALSQLMRNATDSTSREAIHQVFLKIQLDLIRYSPQP